MAAQRAILILIGLHWIATFSESTKQLVDRWWNNTFQQNITGVIQQAQIESALDVPRLRRARERLNYLTKQFAKHLLPTPLPR